MVLWLKSNRLSKVLLSLKKKEMANQALRTIVIAYKDCQNEDTNTKDEFGVYNVEKSGLILLGVLGIKDILR